MGVVAGFAAAKAVGSGSLRRVGWGGVSGRGCALEQGVGRFCGGRRQLVDGPGSGGYQR